MCSIAKTCKFFKNRFLFRFSLQLNKQKGKREKRTENDGITGLRKEGTIMADEIKKIPLSAILQIGAKEIAQLDKQIG